MNDARHTTNMADTELVALCRAGDDAAWATLVDRYKRYVYSICSRGFSLPGEVAEDVFQEVFERAYVQLDGLRDDSAIKPWLAQTTRRLCIDHLRRDRPEQPIDDLGGAQADSWVAELDEALTVRQSLTRLSQACQEILDRFFARDESYATIGAALDIPAGTIASRISRCLAKLRAQLEDPLPVGEPT